MAEVYIYIVWLTRRVQYFGRW